jgi:hypothetical protein
MQTLPSNAQSRRLPASIFVALVAVMVYGCWLLLAATASAADYTWSGGGSSNAWSEGANWLGGQAPVSASSVGTLTFPLRPSQTSTGNDVSGLSVNEVRVDDSHDYSIGGVNSLGGCGLCGDGFTLGSGGLTIDASEGSQGQFSLTTPLTLSSSQTWSVAGPPTPVAWPAQSIVIGGALSGENADLTINLNSVTSLVLGLAIPGAPSIADELGNIIINGSEAAIGGSVGAYKSWVSLAPDATLNASDGHSLTLHNLIFESSTATGPITAVDSELTLSGSSGAVTLAHSHLLPAGVLGVPSLSLDAASVLELVIETQGSQPGINYDQITSTGTVALGGAKLELDTTQKGELCPSPPVGQVDTLISTTGSLSGTFSSAPNGSTLVRYCNGPGLPERWYSYRINYNTHASPETVTATVLPAVPTANTLEPQSPAIVGSTIAGQTLSDSHGTWTNSPTSYAYQWEGCDSAGNNCANISGATGQTYTLTTTDVGHTIRVQETASNSEGTSTPEVSAQTAVVQAAPAGGGSSGGGSTTGSTTGGNTTAIISSAQIAALLGSQLVPSDKLAKIGALLKSGGLTMSFKALEAGTLSVQWYEVPAGAKLAKHSMAKAVLVASGQMTRTGAGTGKIKIRLTAAGKRLLKHARRLKLEAKGTFAGTETSVSTTKAFVVKR